jgi:hypothetical protein
MLLRGHDADMHIHASEIYNYSVGLTCCLTLVKGKTLALLVKSPLTDSCQMHVNYLPRHVKQTLNFLYPGA